MCSQPRDETHNLAETAAALCACALTQEGNDLDVSSNAAQFSCPTLHWPCKGEKVRRSHLQCQTDGERVSLLSLCLGRATKYSDGGESGLDNRGPSRCARSCGGEFISQKYMKYDMTSVMSERDDASGSLL